MENGELTDLEGSTITHLTEKEFAEWQKAEMGVDYFCNRGRYWRRSRLGFCVPVHPLARLKADEAVRPATLSLGFRAALADDARNLSNSCLSYFVLSDLAGYEINTLPQKRRTKLRKCRKLVRIARMTGLAVPPEDIYGVVASAAARTGYWPPSLGNYRENVDRHFGDKRRFIIAGLVAGKLAGFLEGIAIDGTAYSQYLFVATEYLATEIGTGLVFEFSQACRRTEGIREVSYGPLERGDEKLNAFKAEMGFPVARIPIILSINPLLARFMQWRDPENFYRMTGIDRDRQAA